ncbi:hypothetical protein [Streptomyces sp. MJM1172]|uniref:hypothetical protein n=1 Tax=Streptomyces sp. MJM1172 TaxID=1703926 RepID=UPI00268C4A38
MRRAADWGIDPARVAVFGESCGALISALAAIRTGQRTPARLAGFPKATHAFVSMPGGVPQAEAARAEITSFLREALGRCPGE